jgi:hypothetical protein
MKPRRLLIPLVVNKLGSPKWRAPRWLGPVVFVSVLVIFAIPLWVYWSRPPVFYARLRLRGRSCSRSVDDH